MDNEIINEKVLIKKEKLSMNLEQLVESDLSLADYYGDIVKILSCSAQTNIFSSSITGDKAIIDGCADVKIIYIDSSGKIQVADCRIPWGRSVDVSNAGEKDVLQVSCMGEQLNCRAIDARRIEIRGCVTLHIAVFGVSECSFVSDVSKEFCHALKNSVEGRFLQNSAVKTFSLTAETDANEKYKKYKIIRYGVQPVVSEIKTIKNKMMIRGNAICSLTLLTESGEFQTERITVPISQIAELDAVEEDSVCCVALRVLSVDGRITPEAPQAPPKAEINITLAADIDVYKKSSISIVSEAYSSKNELLCKNEQLKCVTSAEQHRDNHTVTSKFDFSSCGAASVSDADVKKIKYTLHNEPDAVVIKGNLHYGIIVNTKENEKMYFERIADFEYKKNADNSNHEINADVQIYCNAINFSVDGESNVTVTTELFIDGFCYNCKNMSVITGIDKVAEITRKNNSAAITVYFASSGEKLWDIAKSHGTCVETIKSMNDLESDCIENDVMLIFELE